MYFALMKENRRMKATEINYSKKGEREKQRTMEKVNLTKIF